MLAPWMPKLDKTPSAVAAPIYSTPPLDKGRGSGSVWAPMVCACGAIVVCECGVSWVAAEKGRDGVGGACNYLDYLAICGQGSSCAWVVCVSSLIC